MDLLLEKKVEGLESAWGYEQDHYVKKVSISGDIPSIGANLPSIGADLLSITAYEEKPSS